MFFQNRNNVPAPDEYQDRISELESELEAAKRLIADQHQVLKSNLSASAAGSEGETTPSADEHFLPPLKPIRAEALHEHPPVKLPDFGPPVGDIAQRVFQAAADQGGKSPPADVPAPATYLDARSMPGFTPLKRKQSVPRSLIISGLLLLGGVLAAGVWSALGSNNTGKDPSLSPQRVAAASQSIPTKIPSTEQQPTKSSSVPDLVKSSPGPVLEAVPVTPEKTLKPDKARTHHVPIVRKAVVKRNHYVMPAPVQADPAPALPERSLIKSNRTAPIAQRPKWRRHHVLESPADEDWFDREARRHPEPGWDEKEDRWLDNLQ